MLRIGLTQEPSWLMGFSTARSCRAWSDRRCFRSGGPEPWDASRLGWHNRCGFSGCAPCGTGRPQYRGWSAWSARQSTLAYSWLRTQQKLAVVQSGQAWFQLLSLRSWVDSGLFQLLSVNFKTLHKSWLTFNWSVPNCQYIIYWCSYFYFNSLKLL